MNNKDLFDLMQPKNVKSEGGEVCVCVCVCVCVGGGLNSWIHLQIAKFGPTSEPSATMGNPLQPLTCPFIFSSHKFLLLWPVTPPPPPPPPPPYLKL